MLIDDHRKQQRASAAGRDVWTARATETGSVDDRTAADELAAAWISEYYPGAVSHSFSESPKGIISRNRWNETSWLILDAERSQVTVEAVQYRLSEHMF